MPSLDRLKYIILSEFHVSRAQIYHVFAFCIHIVNMRLSSLAEPFFPLVTILHGL